MHDHFHKSIPVLFVLPILLSLAACQLSPTPTSTPVPTIDVSEIRQAWQKSSHANTYDVGKGPNTYCARCHAPRNWDPAAKVDAQPNCVSCKFSFDPAMRVAKSNPPVAKADWKDIGCEVCHQTENGITLKQIAWLNTATGQYEAVASPTVLCEKCHTNTETIRHRRDLGTSAHQNFTCTQCHNAHSTVAGCASSECHPNILAESKNISGHDKAHELVKCVACHDASNLAAAPEKGKGTWITFRTTELLGRSTTAAYQSHDLQRTVNCAKCHGPNNPWGLKMVQGTK